MNCNKLPLRKPHSSAYSLTKIARALDYIQEIENLFKDVLSKYAKVCDCDVKDIKLYVYDKPRYGINYSKFIRHVLAGSENLNK